ncbi:MAG: acyl-CoA dehydrogenase family protein, partial [Mycolicibacterium neoaurum]|nr:acyl-CoA dehydrogenase family protein [Mycolicibacterium neoaurum]
MTENTLPSADELRAEVREWLAAHWHGLPKSDDPWASSPERIAWLEQVLDAGYATPTYPTEWYGRAYPNHLANVIDQEFRAVRAPGARQDKYSIPANTVLTFGTEHL